MLVLVALLFAGIGAGGVRSARKDHRVKLVLWCALSSASKRAQPGERESTNLETSRGRRRGKLSEEHEAG